MRYSTLLLLFFVSFFVCAQEEQETPPPQITKTRVIYPAADQFDIWDLRFGHALLTPHENELGLNYFSFNFAAHYLYEFNLSKKRNFAFALGVGYDFQRNHLAGYFKQQENDNGSFTFTTKTNSRTNLQSLSFPFELRYRIKQDWKIYAGYQLLIPLKSMQKYTLENTEEIVNLKPISNTQHGPFFRIGYKDIFLFTRLNFTSLFSVTGYETVKNIQFGISLGG